MTVKVWLKTCQQQDGEVSEVTMEAVGTLDTAGDNTVLCYTEPEQDGERGLNVRITLQPQRMTVERQGDIRSRMLFVPDKRCLCRYDTPYGALTMHTTCTALHNKLAERGQAFASYRLELGEGAPVECTMEILVEEVSV